MVIVSLTGFGVIAFADKRDALENSTTKPLIGDLLSLMSAISYALYATFLKIKVPEGEESAFKFSYFLGFVGLCNDVILIAPLIIFDVTGFETFEWPPNDTLMLLSINAFFGTFISDYCWAKSVLLLGPFLTTLGITITFPLSVIFDSLVNDAKFSWLYAIGSTLIFTAFIVIVIKEFRR